MRLRRADGVSSEFRTRCQHYYIHSRPGSKCGVRLAISYYNGINYIYSNRRLTPAAIVDIILGTYMNQPPRRDDAKAAALRSSGTLNPKPEAVKDEAFARNEFFDRRDRVQVKYEMLRRHGVDGLPVTAVAASFGASRQAFYKTDAAFKAEGIAGLIPRRRGPKRAHKCTGEVLDFAQEWLASAAAASGENVAQAVSRRFGVSLHPRTIDRALARRKKKSQAKRTARP